MTETRTTEATPVLEPPLTSPTPGHQHQVVRLPAPLPGLASMADFMSGVNLTQQLAAARQMADMYNQACAALVGKDDQQEDGDRVFKKKSAWRKLARFFSISTRVVSSQTTEVENADYTLVDRDSGELLQEGRTELIATVTVEAYAPWGQRMEAIGTCSTHERRFHWPNGFQKRWADCLATAETRATNRAVSNLIAAGEVSAEEMEGALHDGDPASVATGKPREPREPREPRPECPKCGKGMYDNRKENDKRAAAGDKLRPEYKCKDKGCDGIYWPGQWPPKP